MIGDVIRGALGARGKRHRGALRALTGRQGSLVTPATLLAALGVAWGLYETATSGSTAVSNPSPVGPGGAPPLPPPAAAAPASASPPRDVPGVAPEAARVIRLTVSAARADGTLSATEEAAILSHARRAGAEAVVEDELRQPTPLASLLSGAPQASRRDLYTLAFAIVRADESVGGAERIYLAQLAHALGLDPAAVSEIESRAAGTIDSRPSRRPRRAEPRSARLNRNVTGARRDRGAPGRGRDGRWASGTWRSAATRSGRSARTRSAELRNGSIDANTLVFTAGMANWAPLATCRAFAAFWLGAGPARRRRRPAAPGAAPTTSTSRSTASEMQFVEVELDPGESAVAEAGSMMYMTPGIEMETVFGDGSQQQGAGVMDALLGAGKRC